MNNFRFDVSVNKEINKCHGKKFFKYVKYSCSIFKLEKVIITALKRWQLRVDIVFLENMFFVLILFLKNLQCTLRFQEEDLHINI